ncbi:MAG: ArsA family ATPase, partial [Acidimicrobiales bacterium]
MRPASLAAMVEGQSILVCCGSGGVGKTTVAATLGMEAARRGRRACVVTIDPAKRLADALGLEGLGNTPGLVAGDWAGELWALMLDTPSTFDSLVRQYATSEQQALSILSNPVYRNIAGALSGTQEYMAMEKLYELDRDGRFDLIVVDTPPTRSALDFLDAPARLTRFLNNRIFKVLVLPTRSYLKTVSVATMALLRVVSKVVGAEVVSDAVAFFQAFEGMQEGFRRRATAVLGLLAGAGCSFVLVTAPRREAVDEAGYFARRLADAGIGVDALVVNRLHPRFGAGPVPAGAGVFSQNLAELRA